MSARFRSIPDRITDPLAPYASLKETRDSLIKEQSDLKDEIKSLQTSISEIQSENANQVLTKSEISDLNYRKAQAGLTRLNGAGVIIKLNDSQSGIATEDSIIHASDLRDIVNLLWSAGAEGIAINDQRVVANTAIDCIVNTILINNVRVSTPLQIEAIGNQNKMFDSLNTSDLLSGLYYRKINFGLQFDIQENHDITLPVYDGSFDINSEPNV